MKGDFMGNPSQKIIEKNIFTWSQKICIIFNLSEQSKFLLLTSISSLLVISCEAHAAKVLFRKIQ